MTTPTKTPAEALKARRSAKAAKLAEAAAGGWKVVLVKLVTLGLVDAIAIYAAIVLFGAGDVLIGSIVVIVAVIVNLIYFSRRMLPPKYLTPGLIFLAVFQIFVVLYSGWVAFTNYGTGHNSTKDDAISAIMLQNLDRVEGSPEWPLTVVEKDGAIFFLVTDPDTGDALVGNAEQPLEVVPDAEFDGDVAVAAPGYNGLSLGQLNSRSGEITSIAVPISDDPTDGALQTQNASRALQYTPRFTYDASTDTLTNNVTGVTYTDGGEGAFVDADGQEITPGWRVVVGIDNFVKAFGEEKIRGPLLQVTIWTFVFSILSVATTFILGLFLAIVFNDRRMRSKRFYRVIMILPYAFPGFLSALVWAGMLNQEFGFVNVVLLGGADIPWLTNEWLAKFSIIFVNLWLGFPYMFLVTTGAIQSIPDELTEAAQMDGARPFQAFRLIKLPLLLVSVAPLLISSFAFNFNNFNLIYMLTGGGPRDIDASINVGATDILISLVYKVAFVGSSSDYGLASAFSIIIFVLVGTISVIAFRQTKALEELN